MPLHFNANHLPEPRCEYICWLDIMGTQSIMARSLSVTANYVFKLHTAAIQNANENIKLYPVMDGLYASFPTKTLLTTFLRSVFQILAEEISNDVGDEFKFIAKCSVAFGPVIHGIDIPRDASHDLDDNPGYRNSILLGLPMVQTNISERYAPPFGVYIHESARSFSPDGEQPFHHVWWKWWGANLPQNFAESMKAYFDWCSKRPSTIQYDVDRIAAHKKMFEEYIEE